MLLSLFYFSFNPDIGYDYQLLCDFIYNTLETLRNVKKFQFGLKVRYYNFMFMIIYYIKADLIIG